MEEHAPTLGTREHANLEPYLADLADAIRLRQRIRGPTVLRVDIFDDRLTPYEIDRLR